MREEETYVDDGDFGSHGELEMETWVNGGEKCGKVAIGKVRGKLHEEERRVLLYLCEAQGPRSCYTVE